MDSRKLKSSSKPVLLVLLLLAPGFVLLLLLLPLWACMQSFRWSDDHPIDASSLPDVADVRSALESGGDEAAVMEQSSLDSAAADVLIRNYWASSTNSGLDSV